MPASPEATKPPSPIDLARADLETLRSSLELIHPDPFHGIERDAWLAELNALAAALDTMDPLRAQVELQRIVALLSREGRDGHQFALPVVNAEGPALPIRVYEFEEGLFITDALPPHADAVGRRIAALNGRPIDEVLAALEPLVPRDGPATVPGFRPMFFVRTSVLRGLSLADEGPITLTVEADDGAEETIEVEPVPMAEWLAWVGGFGRPRLPERADMLYLARPDPALWWEFLPDPNTVYIRYQQVTPLPSADMTAIRERASQPDVERVILDLRQNPGGDNHNYPPLLAVLQRPEIDQEGRLYVLTDRLTFSAASNLATEIEQSTTATFAGEPMGGGLNFWSDVTWVQLPNFPVRMQVGISTRYWQKSTPEDPRLTIEPDIPLPVRAADYFAGRDPVLETILGSD